MSYTVIVTIPVVLYFIALYNAGVAGLKAALERVPPEDHWAAFFKELAAQPTQLSPPEPSFWLLVGSILIAVASTVFLLRCPARIRQFTYQQWLDEIRGSPVNYLPLAWSRPVSRAIVASTLLLGGAITTVIAAIKIWNAAVYIVEHGGAPRWLTFLFAA